MDNGLYIHIPFCRSKCLYCDFYSGGVRIADWNQYEDALLQELAFRREELTESPDTLYIGGGTPSLMPEESFHKLVHKIEDYTGRNCYREFTIEVNPEDVTPQKCRVWKDVGVNRVSLGIQSLNDRELQRIGRGHDSRRAIEAFRLLQTTFENISVDVMFGLPGQTLESYITTLDKIIALRPQHFSSYSLMLEPGTAMTRLAETGRVSLPEEEEWMKMFQTTSKMLGEAGYNHYEISNYALPGYESVHNRRYWKGYPYLGLGPGAHSYDGKRIRRANPTDLKGYLRYYSNDEEGNRSKPFYSIEELSDTELREEMIMTALRTAEGLNLKEFTSRFGAQENEKLLKKGAKFLQSGLMTLKGDNLSLTEAGIPVSDNIISSLF